MTLTQMFQRLMDKVSEQPDSNLKNQLLGRLRELRNMADSDPTFAKFQVVDRREFFRFVRRNVDPMMFEEFKQAEGLREKLEQYLKGEV